MCYRNKIALFLLTLLPTTCQALTYKWEVVSHPQTTEDLTLHFYDTYQDVTAYAEEGSIEYNERTETLRASLSFQTFSYDPTPYFSNGFTLLCTIFNLLVIPPFRLDRETGDFSINYENADYEIVWLTGPTWSLSRPQFAFNNSFLTGYGFRWEDTERMELQLHTPVLFKGEFTNPEPQTYLLLLIALLVYTLHRGLSTYQASSRRT